MEAPKSRGGTNTWWSCRIIATKGRKIRSNQAKEIVLCRLSSVLELFFTAVCPYLGKCFA